MKYSYELKLECVKNYKEGKPIEVPDGTRKYICMYYVRIWRRLFDLYGPDGLKHKESNKD